MKSNYQSFDFPSQRVSDSVKNSAEWYAACCDWIIAQGLANRNNNDDLEIKYGVLHGEIPDEFYKKILNPYNATQEKYKRFPATMRNYDLISGTIRRYVGEYIKNPHDFIVGANNPEVMLARNSKLQKELTQLVQQQIAIKIQQAYQQWVSQGQDPQQFNPQEQLDVEAFVKKFNENYVDEISAQGQELLNVIQDITEDTLLYTKAYFDFIAFGECYTYADVVGSKFIKRNIHPIDAFPINTDHTFREDDDMFACRRKMTYQQIIDEFDDYLDSKQKEFLDTYYAKCGVATPSELTFAQYENYFPDVCKKYSNEDREFFKRQPNMQRDTNTDLYDVWHVVWRGEARKAVVTFVNEAGMIDTKIAPNDKYKLNPEIGDISIEYIYEPQVYECVRIGTRNDAIYPYGCRAIAYNRNGKLPYNGINELLPGFGKFSVIDILLPYQVFYNIVAYHREMIIAKNKLSVLLIAKSLLGEVPEDTIYKMLADGVLYIDDRDDVGMVRAQQIRMLNASYGDYINQLTNLLNDIRESAYHQADMTPQRYGEIANSAGKAVTEQGIIRGSMGSVIIEFVMDCMRERDYNRDLDYTKLAWIDGLDTSYRDKVDDIKYISLNVDNHIYADYIIKAKNSIKEKEKLDQLKQFAFSAAQNGDVNMAIAAITGDNVSKINQLVKQFQEQKEAHEMQIKQMEQQTEQMKQQFELQKIQLKGEEDRKTKELEGFIDKEIELIRADSNLISYNAEVDNNYKEAALERKEKIKADIDRQKIQLERERIKSDNYNKAEDRKVKREDMETKYKIAKENKSKTTTKNK